MKLIKWIKKRLSRKQPQSKLYNDDNAIADKKTGRKKYQQL